MKCEDAGVELVCLCFVGVFLLFVLFCSISLSLFLFHGVRIGIVYVLTNENKILYLKK